MSHIQKRSGSTLDESKLFKKSCKPEWLLKKDRTWWELSSREFIGITQHINHLNLRLEVGDALREFRASQIGHDDVGK
jgi:hypothetical protein